MAVLLLLNALVVALLYSGTYARDYTFTFLLMPGKVECFHDTINEGALLELEYQVIEGGELDIDFTLFDPNHRIVHTESRKMDGLHSFDISVSGEYSICFANEFSRISHKMIYFDIIIEDDSEEDDGFERDNDDAMVLDMKVQDIRKILGNLATNLNRAELTQQFFRAREARHRYSLESSNYRVLWWSCINCGVMLGVGILQVYLIRSLFRSHRQDRIKT